MNAVIFWNEMALITLFISKCISVIMALIIIKENPEYFIRKPIIQTGIYLVLMMGIIGSISILIWIFKIPSYIKNICIKNINNDDKKKCLCNSLKPFIIFIELSSLLIIIYAFDELWNEFVGKILCICVLMIEPFIVSFLFIVVLILKYLYN